MFSWTDFDETNFIKRKNLEVFKRNLEDISGRIDYPLSWNLLADITTIKQPKISIMDEIMGNVDLMDEKNYCRAHDSGFDGVVYNYDDGVYDSGDNASYKSNDDGVYDSSDDYSYKHVNDVVYRSGDYYSNKIGHDGLH